MNSKNSSGIVCVLCSMLITSCMTIEAPITNNDISSGKIESQPIDKGTPEPEHDMDEQSYINENGGDKYEINSFQNEPENFPTIEEKERHEIL